jgi:medium-chain acyl-[acyl-carrier-protein] hydrolase
MEKRMKSDKWLIGAKTPSSARLRLVCFPYAGGGATVFHGWQEYFPADIEVCAVRLPGRESRLGEPPFTDIASLTSCLAPILAEYRDLPLAFFGHSMGALVAFEMAHALHAQHLAEPRYLCVAGFRAPHLQARQPPIHALDEEHLVVELRKYNGISPEVLADRELMDYALPLLRADFCVCETYDYQSDTQLDCPISAIGGIGDPYVTPDEIAAWEIHTGASFRSYSLPGDHFFIHSQKSTVVSVLRQELTALLG